MQNTSRKISTEKQWLEAIEAYELGTHHAAQIAAELGVSSATVSREFKRRGAHKGCRVEETVADLKAELDARAHVRERRRRLEQQAAIERLEAMNRLMDEMIKALVAAERRGDMSAAALMVNEIGRTLGVKGLR